MDNGPTQKIIDAMLDIVRPMHRDLRLLPEVVRPAPRLVHNVKPNLMANNTLKYAASTGAARDAARRMEPPVLWPIALLVGLLVAVIAPAVIAWRRREKSQA